MVDLSVKTTLKGHIIMTSLIYHFFLPQKYFLRQKLTYDGQSLAHQSAGPPHKDSWVLCFIRKVLLTDCFKNKTLKKRTYELTVFFSMRMFGNANHKQSKTIRKHSHLQKPFCFTPGLLSLSFLSTRRWMLRWNRVASKPLKYPGKKNKTLETFETLENP